MSNVSVKGLIATTPRFVRGLSGEYASFRLAEAIQIKGKHAINWFTIVGEKEMATQIETSFAKGDRVSIKGELQIIDWDNGDQTGTTAQIIATQIKMTKAVRRVAA